MKHTYPVFLSIALTLLCFLSGFLLIKYSITTAATDRIASEVLRLHVIANSDSKEDQAVKLKVKSALVEMLREAPINSREEMVTYVDTHIEELNDLAKATLLTAGFSYSSHCELAKTYFPTKTYGDLTFPCGEYLALRVVLGDGDGRNWWCVLYPPLCFIDITTGIVPEDSKETLAQVLIEDDYDVLTKEPVTFHFRLWEELKSWFRTAN